MACCLCGRKSSIDQRALNLPPAFDLTEGTSRQSWWQEGWQLLSSRRPASNEKNVSGDEHFEAPKWKQIVRKLRAESRKLNCLSRSPVFNYDPLSYAMNFDDGCWQADLYGQGYLHSMRFSAPMMLESEPFREETQPDIRSKNTVRTSLSQPHTSSLPVWQRRRASKPPALDLKLLRTRRSAIPSL